MRSTCLSLLCRRQLQIWQIPVDARLQPRGCDTSLWLRATSTRAPSAVQTAVTGEAHDFSPSNLPLTERRLLGRARLHNIFSQEQLLFEADVGNTQNIGTKLADRTKYRQDLELWKLILDVNSHRRGLEGIKATWRGMKYRGTQVRLDTENATAMELLEAFVSAAAASDITFLKQICKDCRDKKMLEARLFVEVVGTLLRCRPKYAPMFAAFLQHAGFYGHDDLVNLFTIACESESESALQCFRDVRRFLPDIKVYHDFIPRLWQLDRIEDAFMMHTYLLSQQDLPQSFDVLVPFVKHFASTGAKMEPFLHGLRAAGISFEAQIRRLYARERARITGFHPEMLNVIASHTLGREPRNLKDETIARALATPGFSFDFVLKCLQPFGLIEVGPISVRQMALKCAGVEELRLRFTKLQEFQIDTGSSAYVRIMKKVSRMGHPELLHLFTKTDMHHEEFEDCRLQRDLLRKYVKKRDLPQSTRSLAILNLGEVNVRAQSSAANLIVRAAVDLGDWAAVLQVIEVFCQQGFEIEQPVLHLLVQALLPIRSVTKGSLPLDFDQIGFLIGILQQLLVSGNNVPSAIWMKPLLALGHLGRLKEVHTLLLWLADFYDQQKPNATSGASRANCLDGDLNKLIMPLSFAVISWDFTKSNWRHAFHETGTGSSQPQPWLGGATLLRDLRDKYGIRVEVSSLQRAFVLRVTRLHTTTTSSRLVSNRLSAARSGVKVTDYLESWSRLWDLVPLEHDKTALLSSIRRGAVPSRRLGRRAGAG